MTASSQSAAKVYRTGGNWSQVYLDMSVDTADPPQVRDERTTSVRDELTRLGAPTADIDAMCDIMDDDRGVPSPVCLFALVHDGEAVVDEVIPGVPVGQEIVGYGPVPDLTPLMRQRPHDINYLVVETSRDGGEVRLYRVGSTGPQSEEHVQGRTDTLHKPQTGGWSHDRYQDHAEEIWRKTQAELGECVDRAVLEHRPRFVVVAGDIRARQLLVDELAEASRALVSIVPTDTRAPGAKDDALVEQIDAELGRLLADERKRVVDLLNEHDGRGDNEVATTLGGVVQALASAQVRTLIVDPTVLGDRTLLALDGEPWVAAAPEDALTAGVVATVPAMVALVRAAVLTDAEVLFADPVPFPNREEATPRGEDSIRLPNGTGAAALLRWRTGPPVPGAR